MIPWTRSYAIPRRRTPFRRRQRKWWRAFLPVRNWGQPE